MVATITAAVLVVDRRCRVRAVVSFEPYKRGAPLLTFTAINHGHQIVRLRRYGTVLPDGNLLGFYPSGVFPGPHLPADLAPGHSTAAHDWPAIVAADLIRWGWSGTVELRAFFEDETRRLHVSRPLRFEIARWHDSSVPTPARPKFDEEVRRLRHVTDPALPWVAPRPWRKRLWRL
jgi:hypothetical protein